MNNDRSDLPTLLERYGAPRDTVLDLDRVTKPEHIRYLDLLRPAIPQEERPDAVVELRGRPVLYVIRAERQVRLPALRRVLALRADGSFLGILEPGRLTVRTIDLRDGDGQAVIVATPDDPRCATTIPELALTPPRTRELITELNDRLFKLLDGTTETLTKAGLSPDDALSLAGRALFLRFLADRHVVEDADVRNICADATSFEECFASASCVAATCRWLDDTFNGYLLPLTDTVAAESGAWFQGLSQLNQQAILRALTLIMERAESTGQFLLNWGDIDFAHVPVGVLSQVYERHSQRYDPAARAKSVYYTPRTIAEYMVDEAFAALPSPRHLARVLDPAVGGGVFLVAAFRKLVQERWRNDGKQPTTGAIREILNTQLAGFEINESALRLTALSLYLTALEIDPHPRPLTALGFKDLRGSVLFNVGDTTAADKYALGSLHSHVPGNHKQRYDLVIGNPPWTSLKRDKDHREGVLATLRPIVKGRLGADAAKRFALPDDVPDLAFIWRSLDWAKLNAQLAFAVHARLLFKQTRGGRQARDDLFSAVRITGILNGAAVRQTDVWPETDQPFALMFARNERPQPSDGFYFVSPDRDENLNARGNLRVDPASATVLTHGDVLASPYVLKTLFRGTSLDVGVLEKIQQRASLSLDEYWDQLGLASGQGFQTGTKAGTQSDATLMHGQPQLTKKEFTLYRVPTRSLPKFDRATLLRTRDAAIYRPPVVLVPEAPSPSRKAPRAAIAFEKVMFNRSFYGYSCADHPESQRLAKYLFLVLNSDLPIYVALLTSGKFGTERDVLHKEDLERLPIVPLGQLTPAQIDRVEGLASEALRDRADWSQVDDFVAQVYGLNKWDREVMRDTLAVAAPFAIARRRAQLPPTGSDVTIFARRLAHDLHPFAAGEVEVRRAFAGHSVPWVWLSFGSEELRVDIRPLVRDAENFGATQILMLPDEGGVALGILAQQRYWTPTRARLLALALLHDETVFQRITGHAPG